MNPRQRTFSSTVPIPVAFLLKDKKRPLRHFHLFLFFRRGSFFDNLLKKEGIIL